MDHILSCMIDTGSNLHKHQAFSGYIEQSPSPTIDQPLRSPRLPPPPQQSPPSPTVSHIQEKTSGLKMYTQPERRYQLFPRDRQQLPPVASKGLDPEQAYALAMGQPVAEAGKGTDKTGLRFRIKEHNLVRRRKISVPELGPMTTVQEAAMDSPTIPGRPPLHERSTSAPGANARQNHLVDCMIPQPTFDELPELLSSSENVDVPRCSSAQAVLSFPATEARPSTSSSTPAAARQPLSPRTLTPLVIPPTQARPLNTPLSAHGSIRLRSGSTPIESTVRSARSEDSPRSRNPFTPLSAGSGISAALTSFSLASITSSVATALSRPRASTDYAVMFSTTKETKKPMTPPTIEESVPAGNTSPAVETASATPTVEKEDSKTPITRASPGHRRGQSESGSIMERGRPRKRTVTRDGAASALGLVSTSAVMEGVLSEPPFTSGLKRSGSKASRSAERRAFELLPRGYKASEAQAMLGAAETAALAAQALQQAARFEVLRREDVEGLSQELRSLDERTEYLRRTYTSLRAGRRNLHARICQYLRSPRVARFSHESMLRQEEALAELDASIDDWVSKLEHAENRRTRVRQKLLEHVAAAATLTVNGTSAGIPSSLVDISETLQMAMDVVKPTAMTSATTSPTTAQPSQTADIATPPRSPTKPCFPQTVTTTTTNIVTPVSRLSPSPPPQRQVPSTILEQPQIEEAMAIGEREAQRKAEAESSEQASPSEPQSQPQSRSRSQSPQQPRPKQLQLQPQKLQSYPQHSLCTSPLSPLSSPLSSRRVDVESIRIYAGDDVYTLLADVENQITHMGNNDGATGMPEACLSEEERKELHRAHSHELLEGGRGSRCSNASSSSNGSNLSARSVSSGSGSGCDSNSNSPKKTSPATPEETGEIFLTSAVFQPGRSALIV